MRSCDVIDCCLDDDNTVERKFDCHRLISLTITGWRKIIGQSASECDRFIKRGHGSGKAEGHCSEIFSFSTNGQQLTELPH
jgi:hypothetical protein